MGDVGCTYLPALDKRLVGLEHVAARFPPRQRPTGFFFGIVDDVEPHSPTGHVLRWVSARHGSATAVVHGPVHRFGQAATPGPFWALAVLLRQPGDRRFRAVSAYAHPVLNRRLLLPVDSDLERRTAALLLDQVAADRFHLLEKPLFDEATASGQWCRPDFVLHDHTGRRVLVETMGRPDEREYLAAKAITHARMRALPGVLELIEHHPDRDPSSRLIDRLSAQPRGEFVGDAIVRHIVTAK
jgi:hypothetical protein